MSNRSRNLEETLLKHEELKDKLDNPYVEKLRVYGFNAINFSGVLISKIGEPAIRGKSDAHISITQFTPEKKGNSRLVDINSEKGRDMEVIVTDFLKLSDGSFIAPEQRSCSVKNSELSGDDTLAGLSRMADMAIQTYVESEKIKNDKGQLSSEVTLAFIYKELFDRLKQLSPDYKFTDYSRARHKYLREALGPLVLFNY